MRNLNEKINAGPGDGGMWFRNGVKDEKWWRGQELLVQIYSINSPRLASLRFPTNSHRMLPNAGTKLLHSWPEQTSPIWAGREPLLVCTSKCTSSALYILYSSLILKTWTYSAAQTSKHTLLFISYFIQKYSIVVVFFNVTFIIADLCCKFPMYSPK